MSICYYSGSGAWLSKKRKHQHLRRYLKLLNNKETILMIGYRIAKILALYSAIDEFKQGDHRSNFMRLRTNRKGEKDRAPLKFKFSCFQVHDSSKVRPLLSHKYDHEIGLCAEYQWLSVLD